MKEWMKEYNLADLPPFIETIDKTRKRYYPVKIDILKDAVSIPGMYVLYCVCFTQSIKEK